MDDDALADRDHRIEHRAIRIGKRAGLVESRRVGGGAAAADEFRPIGLVGRVARRCALSRHQVEHPWRLLAVCARAARAEDGLRLAENLGLHKKIAERRVREIGVQRSDDDFRVTGQLDGAGPACTIRQRHAAHFDVILRRHGDFRVCINVVVAAAKFGAALHKDRLVFIRRMPRRLIGRRPGRAARNVTQIAEGAPPVARGILAPTRDRQVFPPAIPAAGIGDHHVIAAIGQQMHLGICSVRRLKYAQCGGWDLVRPACGVHFRRVWLQRGRDLRDALVQEQLRRLE